MPLLELEPVRTLPASVRTTEPHSIESNVRRALLAASGLAFDSLVVHRIPNGVCLEGVLTRFASDEDVARTVRSVHGVQDVQNHLLFCTTDDDEA